MPLRTFGEGAAIPKMRATACIGFVASLGLIGCNNTGEAPKTATAKSQGLKPAASQPGGPSSASSMPADHSTSTAAIDLGGLFKMPDIDGEVAISVGDVKIGKAEFEQAIRTLQIEMKAAGIPRGFNRYEVLRTATDRLSETARRRLLAQELKLEVDKAKVKAWLQDLEMRLEANPSFKAFVLQAGRDEKARARDAERAVLWRQVQEEILKQVLDESEGLAREYYDKNQKQFTELGGVEAWRIFLKAPRGLVQRDRDIAKARAERLHAEAKKSPKKFDQLASMHSDGGKGPHGGFIGWVPKGTLEPKLEKALYAAKPNTILPLYEAPIGFYIYKAGRTRKQRVKKFEEVKGEILRKVYPARVTARVDKHMNELKARHPVKEYIPELAAFEAQARKASEAANARRATAKKK